MGAMNYIAYIRHGQRADKVYNDPNGDNDFFIMDPKDANEQDPPLTKKGMHQAL